MSMTDKCLTAFGVALFFAVMLFVVPAFAADNGQTDRQVTVRCGVSDEMCLALPDGSCCQPMPDGYTDSEEDPNSKQAITSRVLDKPPESVLPSCSTVYHNKVRADQLASRCRQQDEESQRAFRRLVPLQVDREDHYR